MCRPKTSAVRSLARAAATLALAAWLGGCSDVYWNHRDTMHLSSGDAIATNEMTQMVDPWPPNSGNKNIPYNGQKMQVAVERYRTDKVTQPVDRPRPPCRRTLQTNHASSPRRGAAHGGERHDATVVTPPPAQPSNEFAHAQSSLNHAYRPLCIPPGVQARVIVRDRRRRIRGTGSRHFRRQRADRARCRQGNTRRIARISTSMAPPSSSPISMPATKPKLQALERLDDAHRQLAAGCRRDAELRRQRRPPPDADAGRRFSGQAGAAGRTGADLRPRRQAAGRCRDRGSADFHLPAGRRRRRRHHARGADRDAAAQQRRARQRPRPAWSISTSSTAPAPIISTSSRGSI